MRTIGLVLLVCAILSSTGHANSLPIVPLSPGQVVVLLPGGAGTVALTPAGFPSIQPTFNTVNGIELAFEAGVLARHSALPCQTGHGRYIFAVWSTAL
jgi:hypothetical protein